MEVDDLCFRMGEMILAKKDSGKEFFALKYLKELEKKRSQIVERVRDIISFVNSVEMALEGIFLRSQI